MGDGDLRIGDAERDEAVELLREHLGEGRLTSEEFDERMSSALTAKTRGDLSPLFEDLPGRVPGDPAPAAVPLTPPSVPTAPDEPPWYAQWWMLFVAVGLTMLTNGRLGPLIPLMALWIWAIHPSITRSRHRRRQPPRPLLHHEHEEVMALVRAGQEIPAIKRYRELTGADLVTAKNTVEAWARSLGR